MKLPSKQTICVHKSQKNDENLGINTPVYTSTSYGYLDSDESLYPRYFNIPNQQVLVDTLSKLEKTESGIIFSSGMAAMSTCLLSLLNKGDHIIFQHCLYGGAVNFVKQDFERLGIEYTMLSDNKRETFENALKENTKIIYVETPSNPLLKIIDLQEINSICKQYDLISVIDNTFASPINQNPVDFGIDVVIHSATKYLGGHSDICAGVVLSNNEIINKIRGTSLNLGGSLNALMCYLLERSLKTLAIRVEKQNSNAQKLAEYLAESPKIEKVYYPGLPSHEGHEIAKKQMLGFGGMLSFELKSDDTYGFQKRLKLVAPATSLAGVESTICSPAMTSHRHLTKEEKIRDGISDRLLRFSVGIENVNDLIEDIEQAL